ncbi:MAG: histidinol-phosphatase HisJ family protein [Candidatus Dormibacteria bacterium]
MNSADPEPARADLHVHSQWSWDALDGSMDRTCARAVELGVRAVAFTEHADFTPVAAGARLDVAGYMECLTRCRVRFPGLAIWSGVELGEPHRFAVEAAAVLRQGTFDLVLGSLHCVENQGQLLDCSELGGDRGLDPGSVMRNYFQELLGLLAAPVEFQVLAHLEYPKRYWPAGYPAYRSEDYRAEIEAILEAAVRRGVALELNTTRGMDEARGLCPGPEVVRWWRQAGGRAVAIGSDAHQPETLGCGLAVAQEVARAAGFGATSVLNISGPNSPLAELLTPG